MTQRLLYGLNPVAFGSYVPWGLWVAFYLFFLGLSAGAFLVTTMTYVFRMERFRVIARLSAFTVLICLLCEVLFITLDLGRMARIYRFLITPSFYVADDLDVCALQCHAGHLCPEDFLPGAGRPGCLGQRRDPQGKQMVSAPGARADRLRGIGPGAGPQPGPPALGHQPAGRTAVLRHQRGLFRHPDEPPHLEQCSHPPAVYHGCHSFRWRADHFPGLSVHA